MMTADTSFSAKVKKHFLGNYSLLIFVPPLKEAFRDDSDCQLDSNSVGLDIQSLGAYLHLIFLEVGFWWKGWKSM